MIRKVSAHPAGSNFIYLPKPWYETHKSTGWNGKEVSITSTSKLIIEPYPTQHQSFIISKTPLRLPLGGGGSDLPEYYTKHDGGTWLSAAINNYIYIVLKHRFESQSKFVYSETQYVDNPAQFTNPILRAVFTKYNLIQHLELISLADLPSHLGLGSSGAFTVGLLKAVHAHLNLDRTTQELAEEAYEIERHILGRKIGKQDQYACAHGGLNIYKADKQGKIAMAPLTCPDLQKWLLLFYVNKRPIPADEALSTMTDVDRESIAEIGDQSIEALRNNDLQQYGCLMDKHWAVKGRTQPACFSSLIQHAKNHGAIGGKLIGAGMGGCILVVVSPENQLSVIESLQSNSVVQIPFKFESFGTESYI
jgi:D-glycero-alpha-D-manno-heptose-7-phosphate kinase